MTESGIYMEGKRDKPQIEVGEALVHEVGQSTVESKPVTGHCDRIETKGA